MTSPRPALAKGFIRELDGLRGLAILLVMVHRFWPRTAVGAAADVAGAGWIGVDLFFVISGFLIAGILLDTKGEPGYFRNFYARRALRIFPLYYLFVIGCFVAFAGNPAFREGAGSPLWYLFHLGNVPEGLYDKPVPYFLAPTWSLAIEEQFYLTFPLLVYLLDRRKLTYLLVAMVGLAPAIRLVTMLAAPDQERVQYLFTLCRIDTIAVGCLLAVAVRTVDLERWRTTAICVALAAVPATAVLGIASGLERTSPFDRVFGYSLVAVGCASVVVLVVLARGHRSTAPLRWGALTYLGKLCFGLYLLHRPADTIVSAVAARLGWEGDLRLMPLKIAVAIVLATLSWRLIERPFLHLKDRFASAHHPSADELQDKSARPPFMTRALRYIGVLVVLGLLGCTTPPAPIGSDAASGTDAASSDAGSDGASDGGTDAPSDAPLADAGVDAPPDAPPPPPPPPPMPLYPEGTRHSPLTPAVVTHLRGLAGAGLAANVFAKVGDSITVAPAFLHCFANGGGELGAHAGLAPTIAHFEAGDAAGSSPFARASLAAKGGTTAVDATTGMPSRLDQELEALAPSIAIVLFGTNEIRYGWTFDRFGAGLWELVDRTLARGVVPVLSTMPPNPGDPDANRRIPTANRVIRAIAQGRGVPLVDLHRELSTLPEDGISGDGLHPNTAPGGGCDLTDAGLQYGYNRRNLITLEALKRTRAALAGNASESSAPTRAGSGTASAPFTGSLPLVDLGDTREGQALVATGCNVATSGRERVYRVQLAAAKTLTAHVVDQGAVDVEVRIVASGSCVATGDAKATATVGPGAVDIVVDGKTAANDGEYVLVVEES